MRLILFSAGWERFFVESSLALGLVAGSSEMSSPSLQERCEYFTHGLSVTILGFSDRVSRFSEQIPPTIHDSMFSDSQRKGKKQADLVFLITCTAATILEFNVADNAFKDSRSYVFVAGLLITSYML